MTLINMTPHSIVFCNSDGFPVKTLAPSGTIARIERTLFAAHPAPANGLDRAMTATHQTNPVCRLSRRWRPMTATLRHLLS